MDRLAWGGRSVPIPKMNKKLAIIVGAIAVGGGLAGALALGGDSIGGGFGQIGRSAMNSAVGLFTHTSRSDSRPATAVSKVPASAIQAAHTAAAQSTARAHEAAQVAARNDAAGANAGAAQNDAAHSASRAEAGAAPAGGETGDPTAIAKATRLSTQHADEAAAMDAEGEPAAATDAGDLDASPDADASAGANAGESARAQAMRARRAEWLGEDANAAAADDAAGDAATSESDGEYWEGDDGFLFDDEGGEDIRENGPSYASLGKRDPFYALVTAKEQNARSSDLVDPDRVRLVGIMWGEDGIYAIVEDGRKHGYVLREGDRILYGRVVSIRKDSILVHQMIHGEFKAVELRLESPTEED